MTMDRSPGERPRPDPLIWFGSSTPGAVLTNGLVAGLLLASTASASNLTAALAWLAGLLLALALRLALYYGVQRRGSTGPAALERLRWAYRGAYLLHGLAWAAAMPWLGHGAEHGLHVAVALGVMGVAGLIVHAFDLIGALVFATPVLASLVALLARGEVALPARAPLLGALLLAAVAVTAFRSRQLMCDHARLRDEEAAGVDAMRLSEERLRSAQQLTHVGSFDWRPPTGELDWSDEHFRLWGLEPGSRVPDYALYRAGLHPEDAPEVERRLQAALRGEELFDQVHRVIGADGSERVIHARGEFSFDAQGRALRMIGTVQDITELNRTERELERYRFVVDTVGDMVSIIDAQRVYRLVNKAWCRATGLREEQALGHDALELLPQTASAERQRALRECLELQQMRSVVARLDMPGTGPHWWETSFHPFSAGSLRGAVLVTRDISARVEAELALARGLTDLQMTLNATGDAIFAVDASDERMPVLFANERMLQMWGIPAARLDGLTADEIDAAAWNQLLDPEREMKRIQAIVDSGQSAEDRLLLRDGRTLLRRCIPTERAGQKVRVWSFRDITVEAHALEQLRHAKEEAERANRAKTDFLAAMSHELRTPLNAVLGFAQLLEMNPELADKQRGQAAQIVIAGRHLLELISEVLDLAKVESGRLVLQMAAVDLAALLDECIALVRPQAAQRGITLRLEPLPPAARALHSDRQRLQQALLNLLSNAIKYGGAGSAVTLDSALEDGMLRIRVSDQGPGIPGERMAELFQPFSRLGAERGPVEGTGIGLAITRRLVELIGGRVEASSELGVGSRFSILLPLRPGARTAGPAEPEDAPGRAS